MIVRTDLALESIGEKISNGIIRKERGKAFKVTEIRIENDSDGKAIGRKKGTYVTLEAQSFTPISKDFQSMCTELSDELSVFLPDGEILVAGLGNTNITPDALGPKTVSRVLATRHLRKELADEDEFLSSLRSVSVTASGVLGLTGIETAEFLSAICNKTKPKAVIVIDALACSDINRLGKTIQFSDSGISPGSGVQNKRCEISEKSLGIPVIAIGIPTVVDMHTIINSYTCRRPDSTFPNMMVTPRDIDRLIEHSSGILATGINMALHKELSFDEVQAIMA